MTPIYYPTIMSGAVLRWNQGVKTGTHPEIFSGEDRDSYSGEISASDDCVMVHGFTEIRDQAGMDMFLADLAAAWNAHQDMKRVGHNAAHDVAKRIAAEATAKT